MKPTWLLTGLRESLRCAYTPLPTRSSTIPLRTSRSFSSFSPRAASSIAAPPIDFHNPNYVKAAYDNNTKPFYARILPASPAYFSAQPNFTDDYLVLKELDGRYSGLPRVKLGEAPRVAWRTLMEYRNMVGEEVRATKYYKVIEILQRLNHIHPSLMPEAVTKALNQYKRDVNPYQNVVKEPVIDSLGRSLGAGRRKTSTARAWLVEGTGEVLINGKTLVDAFSRIHDRESAIWALKATDRIGKYNVWALVQGGGTTGQAEALTLAVGKALLAHEPALKPALRRAGCITRDIRKVERKKPGHVKARKMPAWVKR